jgi:hypothetical protein
MIAPAWNCRPWTVLKLQDRPYSDLSLSEKFQKALIPLREPVIIRALAAIPNRFIGELKMAFGIGNSLRYRALHPRWDLIEKYGHVSDDDAVAKIYPHAGICFFRSRGYEISSHPSLKARLMSRYEPLLVRKPSV